MLQSDLGVYKRLVCLAENVAEKGNFVLLFLNVRPVDLRSDLGMCKRLVCLAENVAEKAVLKIFLNVRPVCVQSK